jgi:hypothetical protein
MRRIRDLLGLSAVLLMAVGGCTLTENQLTPPKPVEEYNAPPETDRRYSGPIEYPKETMDNDALLKKAKAKGPNTPGPMNRPGTPGAAGRAGGF